MNLDFIIQKRRSNQRNNNPYFLFVCFFSVEHVNFSEFIVSKGAIQDSVIYKQIKRRRRRHRCSSARRGNCAARGQYSWLC